MLDDGVAYVVLYSQHSKGRDLIVRSHGVSHEPQHQRCAHRRGCSDEHRKADATKGNRGLNVLVSRESFRGEGDKESGHGCERSVQKRWYWPRSTLYWEREFQGVVIRFHRSRIIAIRSGNDSGSVLTHGNGSLGC